MVRSSRVGSFHAPLTLTVVWRWIPFATTSVVALVLFSSWNRPLLYDEFVYFMAGAAPSFGDAVDVVRTTTVNVNQGVTGAYLVTDWFFLRVFGASDWALRLPSLVTGALFLTYAAVFLNSRKMAPWVISLFPIFMLTQDLVMHYVGEARTYMPLAASAVGILAYYSLSDEDKSRWFGGTIGWSAVLLGVFFHPYISIYWPALLVFAYFVLHSGSGSHGSKSFAGLVRFANPTLVMVGAGLYIAVALLTWARGKAQADVDPFNFLPGPLPIEIVVQNFYALSKPLALIGAILFLVVVAVALVASPLGASRVVVRALLAPSLLMGMSFLLALLISWSSIAADFWIFPRQWIASAALTALAIFWGGWLVWRGVSSYSPRWGRLIAGVGIGAIVLIAIPQGMIQVTNLRTWTERLAVTSPTQSDLQKLGESAVNLRDEEWMPFAQANIDSGGRVWPELWIYYRDTDWNAFFLQDESAARSGVE